MQVREIELKAGLSAREVRDLLRLLKEDYGAGQRPAYLRSIYFDTPGLHLKKRGIALRIRREQGRSIQTVKVGRTGVGSFHDVAEQDNAVAGLKPRVGAITDRALREAIVAATRNSVLVPHFETRVRRSRWLVTEHHGTIEIAVDSGHFITAAGKAPILELELELKGGSPEALFDLADRLLEGCSPNLSLPGKASRGFELAAGREISAKAASSKLTAVPSQTPAGDAFEAVLKSLAPAIAANIHATMVHDDPEGPHQLRVSLRRLRAALRLFAGPVDPRLAHDLNRQARDLGRAVSALRDADVLSALVLDAHKHRAASTLPVALDNHRLNLREAARAELRERRASHFALRLQRLAILGGWQGDPRKGAAPIAKACRKPLDDLWEVMTALGDRLSILSDEDVHKLRKTIKQCRYMSQILEYNLDVNDITNIRKLQGALGILNDLVVLSAWKPALVPCDAERELAEIRSTLLSTSRQRRDLALGRACRLWAEIRMRKP